MNRELAVSVAVTPAFHPTASLPRPTRRGSKDIDGSNDSATYFGVESTLQYGYQHRYLGRPCGGLRPQYEATFVVIEGFRFNMRGQVLAGYSGPSAQDATDRRSMFPTLISHQLGHCGTYELRVPVVGRAATELTRR